MAAALLPPSVFPAGEGLGCGLCQLQLETQRHLAFQGSEAGGGLRGHLAGAGARGLGGPAPGSSRGWEAASEGLKQEAAAGRVKKMMLCCLTSF